MTSPDTGHTHAAWADVVKMKKAMKVGTRRRIGRPYEALE
jgi:hypothetical protein